jgi:hypothetical protein
VGAPITKGRRNNNDSPKMKMLWFWFFSGSSCVTQGYLFFTRFYVILASEVRVNVNSPRSSDSVPSSPKQCRCHLFFRYVLMCRQPTTGTTRTYLYRSVGTGRPTVLLLGSRGTTSLESSYVEYSYAHKTQTK